MSASEPTPPERRPSTELQARHDLLRRWSRMPAAERKRAAARALGERDHATLWDLTESYLKLHGRKGPRTSELTLEAYRVAVLALLEHFRGESLLKLGPDDAQLYIRELERGRPHPEDPGAWEIEPLAPSTVVRRAVAARHLFGALAWAELTASNPFDEVKVAGDPERPEEKRQAYTLEEVARLVRAAASEARDSGDRVTLLTILLTTLAGLRASEVVALEWSMIDFDARLVKVVGKGDKPRFAPLADYLALELLRHKRARLDDDPHVLVRDYDGVGPYTAEALRNRVRRLCERTADPETGRAVTYKALHSFRHTFGNQMQKLISLLDLQLILGHTDVKTTSIYGLSTSEKAAARALGVRTGGDLEERVVAQRDRGVNAIGALLAEELERGGNA